MKRLWIKRAFAILGFIAVAFCAEKVVDYFVLPLTNFNVEKSEDRIAHEGEITDVLVGASMVKDSVNPEILDDRLGGTHFNLATNAQSMRLSYYMLYDVFAENNVRRALIEISVNRMFRDVEEDAGLTKLSFSDFLTNFSTKLIYMRENYSLDDLPSVLLLSARCQLKFIVDEPGVRFQPEYFQHYLKNGYGKKPNSTSNYGNHGFIACSTRMRLGSGGAEPMEPSDARSVYTDEDALKNVEELTRIIELCRANGVEPILFTVPCSETWQLGYVDSYDDAHAYFADLAERFGVTYYDFNLSKPLLQQLNDTHFNDPKHMNMYGAEIFSNHLAETLVSGYDAGQFYGSFKESLRRIDRVAGLSAREVRRGGKRYAVADIRMGPSVEPEYRFLLASPGGKKADYRVIQDYGVGAELDLSNIEPGLYTLRVEARSKDNPGNDFEAYDTIDLHI